MLKQKNITLFYCKFELQATICCLSWRPFVTVRDYSKFSQTHSGDDALEGNTLL